MTAKKKVLITGASGLIGGLIRKNLGHKYDFSALNRSKVEGIPCTQVDVSDFDAIQPAFEGIDTVVHLVAFTDDVYEWEGTLMVSIGGTRNIYEAGRLSTTRCRRRGRSLPTTCPRAQTPMGT